MDLVTTHVGRVGCTAGATVIATCTAFCEKSESVIESIYCAGAQPVGVDPFSMPTIARARRLARGLPPSVPPSQTHPDPAPSASLASSTGPRRRATTHHADTLPWGAVPHGHLDVVFTTHCLLTPCRHRKRIRCRAGSSSWASSTASGRATVAESPGLHRSSAGQRASVRMKIADSLLERVLRVSSLRW
ncbi:hypothetical protein DFJ73DRAFT_800708 [Zopfochytrium polystomum]|nr:hypothetical protein DFJ73DRAFT_800708 [Zopfochytrium polystomum]